MNKVTFNTGCFLSILHLEKSPIRSSLFDQKLLNKSPFLSFVFKALDHFQMVTTISFLVSLKTAYKIINGSSVISYSDNAVSFFCTENQRKAIDKLANQTDFKLKKVNHNLFQLIYSILFTTVTSVAKRKSLKYLLNNHMSHITEVIRFIFFHHYLSHTLKSEKMKFAIVANDHSPEPLAFTSICKNKKLRVAYLQHGHVSNYFPPLFRYSLSILYGETSKEIYLSKGISSDKIILSGQSYKNAKPLQLPEGYLKVGVFPNVINEARLLNLLRKLVKNNQISQIVIKPHPAHPVPEKTIKKLKRLSKISINSDLTDALTLIDVGIASNSSIHLELLAQGIPTLYYDQLDDIKFDYYGFVKEGAVLNLEDAQKFNSKRLRDFYGTKNWSCSARRFDSGFLTRSELAKQLTLISDYFSK